MDFDGAFPHLDHSFEIRHSLKAEDLKPIQPSREAVTIVTRRHCWVLICTAVLVLIFTGSAQAQFMPPDVQAADISLAKYRAMLASYGSMEAAIRRLALEKSVPERTLSEVARRLKVKSPELSPAEILVALDRQSEDLKNLQQRLLEIEGGDSRAVAALRRRAAEAFNKLQFEETDRLLTQIVELRRAEIAKRLEAQDLANFEAQIQLGKDLMAQARLANSRQDFDRSIKLLLEAIKEAPARLPSIATGLKGYLTSVYYSKGLNMRDISSAYASLELIRGFREEFKDNFPFVVHLGEAEARILIAELDPTRDNMDKAVAASRVLYATCMARKESLGEATPDYTSGDFGQCHATAGAPGITVARDMLIKASLLLGQRWNDYAAIDAAEPLLREALLDPRIQKIPLQMVLARMRLGIVLSIRADRTHKIDNYDEAIKLYEEDLQKPIVSELPELATIIRVNLAASLVGRGQYEEALSMADRSLREIDKVKQQPRWISLLITKATAHTHLAQGEAEHLHQQEGLAAYRAITAAMPPLDPPERLARLRISFARLAIDAFATSGNINDIEEAKAQLKEADAAIDCSSPATVRAWLGIVQGDYISQITKKYPGYFHFLAAATAYEQAKVTADRSNDPWTWGTATSSYAETIGLASVDEEQGGFGFMPDAIAAFDEVIEEYQSRNRSDLAIKVASTEIDVFVTLGNAYKDKRRRRALFDRAKFASIRLQLLGQEAQLKSVFMEAQLRLNEIEMIMISEKLTRVKPALFGPPSTPTVPACVKQP